MRTALILAVVLSSVQAHGEGFFEGDLGLAVPIADDEYERNVEESLKLGLRVGSRSGTHAFDVGVDLTPFNDRLDSGIAEVDIERYRFLFGARLERPINPKTQMFLRAAVGLDVIHYTVEGNFLGIEIDASETDIGLALEVSGGVLFDVGPIQLGVKLGLPLAFHFESDDPDDNTDADLEYTGVDLDVAFVLAARF